MSRTLKIEILSYWHPGTGRGQGGHLDAVTHRNGRGLPCLPGRTVKGLLRDAVHRWESFGGYSSVGQAKPTFTEQLFGPFGTEGVKTWPGLLRFSDANLTEAETAHLTNQPKLLEELYRDHSTTAIDHDSGTAKERHLRGIELVVPLTLHAKVDLVPGAACRDLETRWHELLASALPMVRAVGAHRSRGLGRAIVTLLEGAP